jgi:hypothetical protein
MAGESDPQIAEAITHSRREAGAHDTVSLDIARMHTARVNRPLTEAEQKAQTPRWRNPMTEKAVNPTTRKSQDPDEQDKDTKERVAKQDVTKETVGEKGAGDYITGTATPDKEG